MNLNSHCFIKLSGCLYRNQMIYVFIVRWLHFRSITTCVCVCVNVQDAIRWPDPNTCCASWCLSVNSHNCCHIRRVCLLWLLLTIDSSNFLFLFCTVSWQPFHPTPASIRFIFWDNFFLCCIFLITINVDPALCHSVLDWIPAVLFLCLWLMINCCRFKVKICMSLEMIYCAWFVLSVQFKVIYVGSMWNAWPVCVCRDICIVRFVWNGIDKWKETGLDSQEANSTLVFRGYKNYIAC